MCSGRVAHMFDMSLGIDDFVSLSLGCPMSQYPSLLIKSLILIRNLDCIGHQTRNKRPMTDQILAFAKKAWLRKPRVSKSLAHQSRNRSGSTFTCQIFICLKENCPRKPPRKQTSRRAIGAALSLLIKT